MAGMVDQDPINLDNTILCLAPLVSLYLVGTSGCVTKINPGCTGTSHRITELPHAIGLRVSSCTFGSCGPVRLADKKHLLHGSWCVAILFAGMLAVPRLGVSCLAVCLPVRLAVTYSGFMSCAGYQVRFWMFTTSMFASFKDECANHSCEFNRLTRQSKG